MSNFFFYSSRHVASTFYFLWNFQHCMCINMLFLHKKIKIKLTLEIHNCIKVWFFFSLQINLKLKHVLQFRTIKTFLFSNKNFKFVLDSWNVENYKVLPEKHRGKTIKYKINELILYFSLRQFFNLQLN